MRSATQRKSVEILLQVNTSGETQKFGCTSEAAFTILQGMSGMTHIQVKGLMTIAPLTEDEAVVRSCFRSLKKLFEKVRKAFQDCPYVDMKYLSMGMSHDYEIDLEEGSNMIRIGRAIFGETL